MDTILEEDQSVRSSRRSPKSSSRRSRSNGSEHQSVRSKSSMRSPKSASRTSNESAKGLKSISILDFMPLHSKLAIDITLLALSLEKHGMNNPKDDIYDKIKDNKTFKLFFKALDHSFNGIDPKLFSYLFISMILCTSKNMEFSFKEFGFVELDGELQKYAKEFSSYVLEELSSGVVETPIDKENNGVSSRRSSTKKNKPGKLNSTVNKRKNVYGGKKTSRVRSIKYRQTGGWIDLLITLLVTIFARLGPTRNRRFLRITLPVMFMYFIYSVFSVYNNYRHICSPNGIFGADEAAASYSGLMGTTSAALVNSMSLQDQENVRSHLGEIGDRIHGLPLEVETFMGNRNFEPSIGQILGIVVGFFGLREGAIDQIAPMINRALTEFMRSEYYTVTVGHIQNFASDIARKSTASIARTRTAPQSTGIMGVVRSITRMFGFDIAGVDDQLGDILYNTANVQQISNDVLQTVMRNSRIAITRLTEDFTGLIEMETTRFRTRLDRHGWGIRHALVGTFISGYWLYLYLQYCREVQRRRKEIGTVGSIHRKHNSRSKDDDGSGNGHKRLGNGGDGDGDGGGGDGDGYSRQLNM